MYQENVTALKKDAPLPRYSIRYRRTDRCPGRSCGRFPMRRSYILEIV